MARRSCLNSPTISWNPVSQDQFAPTLGGQHKGAQSNPGPRDQPQRGHHRQPVGKDHGKRGPRGYDAGKKVKGRKRHIVVDTLGLLLAVAVHPADIQDRDGARLVLRRLMGRFPRLQLIWADGAYGGWWLGPDGGRLRNWCAVQHSNTPSRCCPGVGWWNAPNRQRRLSKDYEALETTETWIYISMTGLMLRRLARLPSF